VALRLQAEAEAAVEVEVDESVEVEEGCHDMKEGEGGSCMKAINWAKNIGFPKHPDWYPGFDPKTTPLHEWQMKAWNTSHPTCPRPCSAKVDVHWCQDGNAPTLWKPAMADKQLQIKILSYNLFWWNLFKIRGGQSAGQLIKSSGEPQPYDVIGLQECEDPDKVFGPPGLQGTYTSFIDRTKSICVAFRTSRWTLLARGSVEVADDMRTEHYGRRSAQWMRLQDRESNAILFFVNHHGPLSVNSGGACGGKSTANNLMKVMATHGQPGDVLILVGDFNANAASRTIQSLWPHMLQVYNGIAFGGVDNIFSNVDRSAIGSTQDLGSGGSDHHAISAVLDLGPPASPASSGSDGSSGGSPSPAATAEPAFSVSNLEHAKGSDGCLIEPETKYGFAEGTVLRQFSNINDARVCCVVCQGDARCHAWTWTEWNAKVQGPMCVLRSGKPTSSNFKDGFASGLPQSVAVKEAEGVAASASKR